MIKTEINTPSVQVVFEIMIGIDGSFPTVSVIIDTHQPTAQLVLMLLSKRGTVTTLHMVSDTVSVLIFTRFLTLVIPMKLSKLVWS